MTRIQLFFFYSILTTTLTLKYYDLSAQDSLIKVMSQDEAGLWLIENAPLSKVLNLLAAHYHITILNPDNIDTTVMMTGNFQNPIEVLMRELALNYRFNFEMIQDTIKLMEFNSAVPHPEWWFHDNPLDEVIQEIANSYNYRVKFIYRPTTRVHFIFLMEFGIDDILAQLALLGVNLKLTFKIVNKDRYNVHVDRIIIVRKGRIRKALFFPIAALKVKNGT
jgi:hypothetical protein